MPGIRFGEGAPQFVPPTATFVENFTALLNEGKGMVFLHHAIAGWPAWEGYANTLGGRFCIPRDTGQAAARQRLSTSSHPRDHGGIKGSPCHRGGA